MRRATLDLAPYLFEDPRDTVFSAVPKLMARVRTDIVAWSETDAS